MNLYNSWNSKQFFFINKTILHYACESGNIDIVKYIISLDVIDIKSQTIFL